MPIEGSQPTMNFCTSCGSPAGDGRFCGNCGSPLTAATDQQPTDQQPTDQQPTDQQPTDQQPSGQQPGGQAPGGAHHDSVQPQNPQPWDPGAAVSQQLAPDSPSGVSAPAVAGNESHEHWVSLTTPASSAETGQLATPSTSLATPRTSLAGSGDLGDVIRSNPGPALRAGAVLVLVIIALIKPWELTALGLWGATESNAAAGNGWALLALLLVAVAAAIGFFADNVRTLELPIEPRVLQAVLVAPLAVLAVIAMIRMLAEESVMGPSVAIGLVAAILAVQIGAPLPEASTARQTAMVLLVFGAVLTLWQLRGIVELGRVDGMLAVILFITVGWIPLLAAWFVMGLREHKPAEWAALIVFGAALLAAMLLVSGGADVGLTLLLAGATVATAPGLASLMQMSPDPADRWLQWAAGVMVLWMVGGAVMCVIGLFGAIQLSGSGIGVGALVWIGLWGAATAIVAGVARNKLVEDPAVGRMIAVIFAAVSVLIYVVSLAAIDADLTEPATLLVGLTVPVVIVLMLAVPGSVNRRYGNLLPTSTSGRVVD
ncbi:hypothetical protein FNH13_08260 [Ornithinimicrobium ciconiae]|uniref:DUF7937 domain-containing protein n=1 Tax=Ornithinimicrobium ciconiae TaxID=2594265 RepID=A0A516GA15_9MICO|nr:hypothetical protein [Ornithinimicrobium ciconiae]QDO88335.1 hypothetical protein FNH13_08260 [Ornithinimicrobium ciconiae]